LRYKGTTKTAIEIGQESLRWSVAELFDDWYYSIERSLAAE
jgi:hypothetical protein